MAKSFGYHIAEALLEAGWVGPGGTLRDAITEATARTLAGLELRELPIRVERYVDPEDYNLLFVVRDIESGESVMVTPAQLAALRSLLCSIDETAGPQAGDEYLIPTIDGAGYVRHTYYPEHEEDSGG